MLQMARSRALIVTLVVMLIVLPIFLLAIQFLLFGIQSLTPQTQVREAVTFICTVIIGMCVLRHVRKIERRIYVLWENQQKFYEMLSHDLKNPISAILMSMDLMPLEKGLNTRALTIIRRNAQNMMGLIDSFLLSGLCRTGRLNLNRQLLTVREVVANVVGLLEPFILRKHISVTTDIQPDLKCYADCERLKQILSNIISNAIRYTPLGGSVTIKAYRNEGHRAVHFAIQDTGPGIPQDKLENIFDPYVRNNDNPVGHGLGLAIVKQLVNAHGGVVWAESIDGRGSRFYFKLPDQKITYLAPESPA